ncbi:hypothetical protein CEJ63_21505, partial [Acinetobacter baumannii]
QSRRESGEDRQEKRPKARFGVAGLPLPPGWRVMLGNSGEAALRRRQENVICPPKPTARWKRHTTSPC